MRLIFAAVLALVVAGCTGKPSSDDVLLSDAKLDLEEFFAGDVKAYGQFQDVLGRVQRRFEVDIASEWDGTTLRLVEDFRYSDGATEQRIWTLKKTGADTWEGTAPGVIGMATGVERGDTFNWTYEIDLPVPSGVMRVAFDDWMWKLSDRRVLNRAYMTRYGVYIGDVIIIFEKD